MKFEQYKIAFSEKAFSNGYSSENIDKCLKYAETLLNKDLPIVYDISHFASLVGYKRDYIERAIVFTNQFYRKFYIPKTNGELRRISEPLPSLKDIQLWILKNILYKIEANRFAKAYVPGITLKQNLVFHKEQSVVLTIDVKDFFSSIKKRQVKTLFRILGYSTEVADFLSKLCSLNDKLPQGAPTSPYISNLKLSEFDDTISSFCLKNKIRFTRYADDMTFSGTFEYAEIISLVKTELAKISLEINPNKLKIRKSGTQQLVTGVVVNKKLQVPRYKRKKIRQEIYYIKKWGITEHLNKIDSRKANYIEHLLGKVLFVLFINPDDLEFLEYKKYLNSLQLYKKS